MVSLPLADQLVIDGQLIDTCCFTIAPQQDYRRRREHAIPILLRRWCIEYTSAYSDTTQRIETYWPVMRQAGADSQTIYEVTTHEKAGPYCYGGHVYRVSPDVRLLDPLTPPELFR